MKRKKTQSFGIFFLTLVFLVALLGIAACTEILPPTDTNHSDSNLSATLSSGEKTDTNSTDDIVTNTSSDTGTEIKTETDTNSDSQTSTDTDKPQPSDTNILLNPGNNGRPDGIKRIAFTFDDGPYSGITNGLADEFAKYGGHCTYFVVGNRIKGDWATALKYASDLGNEVGIHGYTHTKYYHNCSESDYQYELSQTAAAIKAATGKDPKIMRPIGGNITNSRVNNCPYAVITWNIDPQDWKYKKPSQSNVDILVKNILRDAKDGGIVCMHDIYENTYEAIKIALPLLKEEGYEFVTVSEIIGDKLQPGAKFNKGY